MAKRRKRRRSSSPATKMVKAKAKNSATLCFQDVWEEYCCKNLVDNEENIDEQISDVFFELANAPSVSYRLEAALSSPRSSLPPPTSDDRCEIDTNKNSNVIVIQQDVSGAAENHTGGIVWETSYLLLNYLLSSSEWLETRSRTNISPTVTRTVLEIGAGCGMLGLSLHKAFELGILEYNNKGNSDNVPGISLSSRVVLTETNELMKNLRANFERNYPPRSSKEATEKLPPVARHQVSVEELDWTRCREDCARAKIDPHSIDCIVGTDVVFSTRFVLPMLETMRFLSHPRTVIYLCLQERCRDSHRLLLLEAINYGFAIKDISESVYQDEALADLCRFGRALECKLLKFTVLAMEDTPTDMEKKKIKEKKKKKSKKKTKEQSDT